MRRIIIFMLLITGLYAKTYVVFRYDDFSGDIPEKRDSEPLRQKIWEKEQEMDLLFQKYNIPYHLAIIPERKSGNDYIPFGADYEKVDFVKKGIKDNRIEVSQHGFRHIIHVKPGYRASEFSDRTYQEQYEDISKGKKLLEVSLGHPVDIFVPPCNGWSYLTGQVLQECGFDIFSADRYYRYDSISNMSVIPFTALIPEIESLDVGAIKKDSAIVILFHPAEIVQSDLKRGEYGEIQYISMERLESLLVRLTEAENVKIVTMKELQKIGDFSFEKYIDMADQYAFYRLFSPIINFDTNTHPLVSIPLAKSSTKNRYCIALGVVFLSVVLAGFTVGIWLYRIFNDDQKKWLFLLIFIITLMVLVKVFFVYYKGFTLLTIKHIFPFALMVGLFLGIVHKKIRHC